MPEDRLPIHAVVFDFDGTLTLPGALDFPAIKADLGCPAQQPLLEFIAAIEDPPRRRSARKRLDLFETRAAAISRPNPGAQALVLWLKQRGILTAILTRNSRASVLRALGNFDPQTAERFDLIVTRDDPVAPKPSGEGLLYVSRILGIAPARMLMVGDFVFDCQAGRAAGTRTVLLDRHADPRLADVVCDHRIRCLAELKRLIAPTPAPRETERAGVHRSGRTKDGPPGPHAPALPERVRRRHGGRCRRPVRVRRGQPGR